MNFWQWVPIWFARQTLNRKLIFLMTLISPLTMLIGRYRYSSMVSQKYLLAYILAFAGSIFWFLSAPDIRFGYGFLIGTCVLSLSPFFMRLTSSFDKLADFFSSFGLLLLFIFLAYTLWSSFEVFTFSQRWLLPADYPPTHAQKCEIAGAVMYCRKEGGQCQYDSFPCIPGPRIGVEMRGTTFQDGFRSNR